MLVQSRARELRSYKMHGAAKKKNFFFLGSKITTDDDSSLGRKVMTNLDSVLKSREITLSTKVQLLKAMVFPVVM